MSLRWQCAACLCLATLPACHQPLKMGFGDAGGSAADATSNGMPEAPDSAAGFSDVASEAGPAGLCDGVAQLAAGLSHVCAVKTDGTLWCWGTNGYGQLGDGTFVDKAAPVPVSVLGSDVVQVAAGYNFTCARKRDGTVWCWGDDRGKLGSGDASVASISVPVQVTALGSTVAQVAIGGEHACARKTDGTLWCWGTGYLGDGSAAKLVTTPTQVTGFGSVASVSVSWGDICVVGTDGSLWCWGDNVAGQLGDGTTHNSSVPLRVAALGGSVASVSSGYQDICVTKTDGTLWCWGWSNRSGSPSQVTSLGADVVQVASGEGHSCARKSDGTLWCWGGNSRGQLGDGTTSYQKAPVQVAGLTSATDVVVSNGFTCAVVSGGALRCWGANDAGDLGIGTTSTRTLPYAVASLGQSVAQLTAGYFSFCARKIDGSVWCWGDDPATLLADGSAVLEPIPLAVSALGQSVVQVAAGSGGAACALMADGGVWCWGEISNSAGLFDARPVPFQITGLPPNLAEVAVGWGHACARAGDGTLWCWGRNDNGELGDGSSTFFSETPVEVSALGRNVTSVATRGTHTCARTTDGTLWCWGSGGLGLLGNGTTLDSAVPVAVTGLGSKVRQVATGPALHTCAVLDDGTAWCWGRNDDGQLGDGTTLQSLVPVQVAGLQSVVQISAGESHTCAVTSDDSLWCWGDNSVGQLGNGNSGQNVSALTPVRVAALGTDVAEVSAGIASTCARSLEGGVWCWGTSGYGMTADGTIGSVLSPTAPQGCP